MSTVLADLGIVIVSYNNEADLPDCLNAIQENAPGSYVVVRDCNSADQTVQIAKDHPVVSRVITGRNVGFGAGCNDGVRAIEKPVGMLLLLNPDTAIGCRIEDLLDYVKPFGDFGCIGIQQRSFEGSLAWSWDEFPSPALEWRKARKNRLLQRSPEGYSGDRLVDWVVGAFLLIPRAAFEAVGGFDERFFMFWEEIDLCRRLGEISRPAYYLNDFHFLHSQSDKATLWRAVQRLNSRRMYDQKWLRRTDTLLCRLAHSYRWMSDIIRPVGPRARRLALPRLLATWNLIQAVAPPESIQDIDSWRAVQPFWKGRAKALRGN
jgi:N-acetylglucosaminyl-diphospho-decaprenol L-rhamnosyltransferase